LFSQVFSFVLLSLHYHLLLGLKFSVHLCVIVPFLLAFVLPLGNVYLFQQAFYLFGLSFKLLLPIEDTIDVSQCEVI